MGHSWAATQLTHGPLTATVADLLEYVAVAPVKALIIELGPHLAYDPDSPRSHQSDAGGRRFTRLSIAPGERVASTPVSVYHLRSA